MGYYVNIQESTFMIPVENLDTAYEKMCQLNFTVPNSEKGGGSWGGKMSKDNAPQCGPYQAAWFSWMDWNYHETCSDANEILERLGFETHTDENGNLFIDYYEGKTGQESLFLESISSLSKGYIIWKGEQDELWGETYGGGKVIVKERVQQDYSDLIAL